MSTWITAPLCQGPLSSNYYSYSITGLSANTTYEYRAYMIVSGSPYYGNICQKITLPMPTYVPTISTGLAYDVTDTSMMICDNEIINKGGASIIEYGVIYTQLSAYGNANQMIYYNPHVCKKTISEDIATGVTYFTGTTCILSGLTQNTQTYFRAFALNSAGFGYGTVKTQMTDPTPLLPPINIYVDLTWIGYEDPSSGFRGEYSLKCCTDEVIYTKTINTKTYNDSVAWSPAGGCYYVDFSDIVPYDTEYMGSPVWVCWNDNYYSGVISCSTSCFSTDNTISADISTQGREG